VIFLCSRISASGWMQNEHLFLVQGGGRAAGLRTPLYATRPQAATLSGHAPRRLSQAQPSDQAFARLPARPPQDDSHDRSSDIEFPGEEEGTLRGGLYRTEGAEAPAAAGDQHGAWIRTQEGAWSRPLRRAVAEAGFVVSSMIIAGSATATGLPRNDIRSLGARSTMWRRAISYREADQRGGSSLGIWVG